MRLVRIALRVLRWVVLAVVVYLGVTAVQVWMTAHRSEPQGAGAIVVMGAAQYDGVPSPDLRARLDEAARLWHAGYAQTIVVTGSKEPGDTFTEAQASARYLTTVSQVRPSDIKQVGGRNSWESLQQAAIVVGAQGSTDVLIVTDPFHEARCLGIASSLGLTPFPTPATGSPIGGLAAVPYYAKETVGVAVGRIVGYNHLDAVHLPAG